MRFFARKSTDGQPSQSNKTRRMSPKLKLCLIYLLVVACISTPVTLSKYVSQTNGSSTARVAKFDITVNYQSSGYGELTLDGNIPYCVVEEFTVTNTGEVSCLYDINLLLSEDISSASYGAPSIDSRFSLAAQETNYTYIKQNPSDPGKGITADLSALSTDHGFDKSFSTNTMYYAFSENGTEYTWYAKEELEADDSLQCGTMLELDVDEVHYYKIIYFIHLNDNAASLPQMTLFYSIHCIQND